MKYFISAVFSKAFVSRSWINYASFFNTSKNDEYLANQVRLIFENNNAVKLLKRKDKIVETWSDILRNGISAASSYDSHRSASLALRACDESENNAIYAHSAVRAPICAENNVSNTAEDTQCLFATASGAEGSGFSREFTSGYYAPI